MATRGRDARWLSGPAFTAHERGNQAASTKFAPHALFPSPLLPQAPKMATSTSSSPRIGHSCPAASGAGAPLRSLALVSLLLASLPAPTAGASVSPNSRPHRELISKDAALSKAACFGSYPRYVLCACHYLPKSAVPRLSFLCPVAKKRGQKGRK